MLRQFTRHRTSMFSRGTALLIAFVALSSFAAAQNPTDETEKLTGKLVEATKKGRTTTLVVNVGGEDREFVINSKVDFGISSVGDEGFLREGSYVATEGIVTSDQLFANDFTVYPDKDSRPKAISAKAPPAPGRSKNAWLVAGNIVSRGQHEQYEQYDLVEVKARGNVPVLVERSKIKVTVRFSDIERAKPGTPVELEGKPGRGGRFDLTKATVQLPGALKAEEFFAESEEKK